MIEDILRGAQVCTPAYNSAQRAEDNRRLHDRIDQVALRRAQAAQLREDDWLVPSSPELAELLPHRSDEGRAIKKRLERDLNDLCRAVIRAPGVGDRLVEFADASSPTDQVGARAFGCLLYLGEQPDAHDGARFWWRYAAGVGDSTAAYALFLEGLLRDEPVEAVFCYRSLDGSGFLCDEDWDNSPSPISAAERTLRAEVDEHLQEVTGPSGAGHLLIPSGYLGELSQNERDELCHQ